MPQQKRQLAAIMFTDIVGYTALMGNDSNKAMQLVRQSIGFQKPLVEKHNGKWLKELGDGVLAQFSTALDAVNCAIEIQETARAKFDGKLRVGIHLGDVTIENNDVYGDGVNIAARLESIADPGGIYISESIERAIRGQTNVPAIYLGELRLKNVDYEVRTYALQGAGLPLPDFKDDKNLTGRFMAELYRRGILRAGVTYIVFALLLILLTPYAETLIDLPPWFTTTLYTILIAGFPVAVYMAWLYEKSPEGFVETTSQKSWQNPYKGSQKKPFSSNIIIAVMGLIIVFMYVQSRDQDETDNKTASASETEILDKSIAVLPFDNDSPDPDNEYFCNGMMVEILNHLQSVADLGVKSRTAVEPYSNTNKSFATIAEELKVSYILEGAVRKYGDRFRITTQLIDVKSGNNLWADTYDGIFSDTIFIVQSNIAKKIAASMNAAISPAEARNMEKIPTSNIAAYDLRIRATHEIQLFWSTFDQKHLEAAHSLLDKAIEIDPAYVEAIVGKGTVFMAERKYDSALAYSDKALALDPDNAMVYTLKGECFFSMGKDALAIENYLKAMELNPGNAWIPLALGRVYLWQKNDVIKALPLFQRGFKLSHSTSSDGYNFLAQAYMNIGDYGRSEEYLLKGFDVEVKCEISNQYIQLMIVRGDFQKALQFTDSICRQLECDWWCKQNLFRSAAYLEDFEKAEHYFREWQNAPVLDTGMVTNRDYQLGYIYYRNGKMQLAENIFNEEIPKIKSSLNTENKFNNRISYWHLSRIYAFMDNKVEALKYLHEYAKLGFARGHHDFILKDPYFENLRDDPEFKQLVKRAQDEKAALRAQIREMEERGELDL